MTAKYKKRRGQSPCAETYGITLKLLLLVRVPLEVVTTTGPVVAPLGTTAVMYVSDQTLKLVADEPLKVTLVAPVNPCPKICAL